eukprot:gene58209-biopygen3389
MVRVLRVLVFSGGVLRAPGCGGVESAPPTAAPQHRKLTLHNCELQLANMVLGGRPHRRQGQASRSGMRVFYPLWCSALHAGTSCKSSPNTQDLHYQLSPTVSDTAIADCQAACTATAEELAVQGCCSLWRHSNLSGGMD